MSVTLEYTLSQDEFVDAMHVAWSHQGIGDRGNWILAFVAGGVALALLWNGFATGWIWLCAPVFFVLFTLLRTYFWRQGYGKMIKYSAPITATFSKDVVQTSSAQGQSSLPWSTFTAYMDSADYIFLFLNNRSFSILPKSAIDTANLEILRTLFAANLSLKKRRWI